MTEHQTGPDDADDERLEIRDAWAELPDTDDRRREERQRRLAEIRERTQEAVTAHSLSDEESELGLIDADLDRQQAALDKLMHDDPVGMTWFGDRDDWVDKRMAGGEDPPPAA